MGVGAYLSLSKRGREEGVGVGVGAYLRLDAY